jgi:hypothetical protein
MLLARAEFGLDSPHGGVRNVPFRSGELDGLFSAMNLEFNVRPLTEGCNHQKNWQSIFSMFWVCRFLGNWTNLREEKS